MRSGQILWAMVLLLLIAIFSLSPPNVAASPRCQVRDVSTSIPLTAARSEQIQSTTSLSGSCATTGEDYYSVRVDLIDAASGLIVSSNSTPIGYYADNFTVTVENMITTPSNNGTWHLDVDVYVIRAGGTGGSYLLDYKSSSNATIQIGTPAPVPEFALLPALTATVGVCVAVLSFRRRKYVIIDSY